MLDMLDGNQMEQLEIKNVTLGINNLLNKLNSKLESRNKKQKCFSKLQEKSIEYPNQITKRNSY